MLRKAGRHRRGGLDADKCTEQVAFPQQGSFSNVTVVFSLELIGRFMGG